MATEIILHRGYKGKYLENSIEAFKNAINEKMSFETDIRTSKDKECFLIHDDRLERLFNIHGRVTDYNSEKLSEFRHNKDNSLKLVNLRKLCDLIKKNEDDSHSYQVFMHLKQLKDIYNVMNILLNYDLTRRIKFFACDDITMNLVDITKKEYPQYNIGLHITDDSPYLNKKDLKKADFIWADEIKRRNITKKLIDLAHSLEKPVYVISPEIIPESIFNKNIKEKWKQFLDINVDGICTDKPFEVLDFIRNY